MSEEKKLTKQEKEQIRLQKQQELEDKIQKNYDELLSGGISGDTLQVLQNFFSKQGVEKLAKSEKEDIKIKYAQLFQQILAQANQETIEKDVLSNLNDKEQIDFFDYMNKSFEMVGEGKEVKFHPNFLLKLHDSLMKTAGVTVILKSISRKNSIVKRYDNDLEKNTI